MRVSVRSFPDSYSVDRCSASPRRLLLALAGRANMPMPARSVPLELDRGTRWVTGVGPHHHAVGYESHIQRGGPDLG